MSNDLLLRDFFLFIDYSVHVLIRLFLLDVPLATKYFRHLYCYSYSHHARMYAQYFTSSPSSPCNVKSLIPVLSTPVAEMETSIAYSSIPSSIIDHPRLGYIMSNLSHNHKFILL
jgi:hypothetical protein